MPNISFTMSIKTKDGVIPLNGCLVARILRRCWMSKIQCLLSVAVTRKRVTRATTNGIGLIPNRCRLVLSPLIQIHWRIFMTQSSSGPRMHPSSLAPTLLQLGVSVVDRGPDTKVKVAKRGHATTSSQGCQAIVRALVAVVDLLRGCLRAARTRPRAGVSNFPPSVDSREASCGTRIPRVFSESV